MKSNKASISLISMLIISAFTLILVVAMSEANISTNYQYLNNYIGKDMYYAAESCLAEGIIRYEADSAFTGTTINIDSYTSCSVAVSGTSTKQFDITVTDGSYTQTFRGTTDVNTSGEINNLTLSSWQKL